MSITIVAGIAFLYRQVLLVNQTTVALTLLLAILAVSAVWGMAVSVFMSVVAMLVFNYEFLPPIGTFTIADPQNHHGQSVIGAHPEASRRSAQSPTRDRAALQIQSKITGRRKRHPVDECNTKLCRGKF
jgi:hypothetical protein